MNLKIFKLNSTHCLLTMSVILLFNSCLENKNTVKTNKKVEIETKPNDIIPFFQHWNLILGDGSNVGQATGYKNKDFFFTTNENNVDWVVFKTPNAGCRLKKHVLQ